MQNDVAIIIPTYNQPQHLAITLSSVMQWTKSIFKIYVVDNSETGYAQDIAAQIHPDIVVIRAKSNLGWMGGINHGIRNSQSTFVLMLNDDIKILDFDHTWLNTLMETFNRVPGLGAVGPSSNMVMGYQNFMTHSRTMMNYKHGINEAQGIRNVQHFLSRDSWTTMLTTALSGFCLLVKRSIIDEIGLLDEELPGGDDLDISIRMRKAGYKLAVRKNCFVYHFGSKTGVSVYREHWNSPAYSDAVNIALIKKHGFKSWHKAIQFYDNDDTPQLFSDWEKETILKYIDGRGADIGCGAYKIHPDAIGVDVTPGGQRGNAGSQAGMTSQAQVTIENIKTPFTDGQLDYVCARHVIEHIVNPLAAIKEWLRILKYGGVLVIAAPDEDVIDGIPLDPSHKHAMTVEFIEEMIKSLGVSYDIVEVKKDHISFVMAVRVYI